MGSRSISDLTEELLMEIFSKLQAKPVARCKCVCKPWRTLLSDPSFIKLHLVRSLLLSKPPNLLLSGYPFKTLDCGFLDDINDDEEDDQGPLKPIEEFNVDGGPPTDPFGLVIGSCNGLLCLSDDGDFELLYLLNPCTREFVHLPFDPSFICHEIPVYVCQGFGYDRVADQYKAVRIAYKQYHTSVPYSEFLQVMVYTLGTPGWRKIEASPPTSLFHIPSYVKYCPMIHVNGVLHCLNMHPSSKSVISFDLHTEKFGLIPLPDYDQIDQEGVIDRSLLNTLNGCLVLERQITVWDYEDSSTERQRSVDIWMMNSYWVKESWVIVFSFTGVCRDYNDLYKPLFILKDGRIVLRLGGVKLLLYNPGANITKCITISPKTPLQSSFDIEASYVEALTSISSLMHGNRLEGQC